VRTPKHVRWLLGAFVAASTLSGAYGLVVPPPPGEEDRLAGTIGEPNQLAAVLVAGIVIALAAGARADALLPADAIAADPLA
jgi:hypothetical protein